MRLLVLGGTRFVGRALVEEALTRGWDVTALHRGRTGVLPDAVTALHADRTDPEQLGAALHGRSFDLAVDTWASAPRVVRDAARLVEAGRSAYVSSQSVYRWGSHVDERSPLVDGDPDAGESDYAADKRGGELASRPEALLLRVGLILGPYEDVGRLPWWLTRVARGGRVVAPGRPDRPLQYVDVRDLAAFALDALARGESGQVDVTAPSGHATTRTLLEACVAATGSDAELVWVDEETLERLGVQPWTQLPVWVPERGEFAGFLESDVSRAVGLGLRCRPVEQTVDDTWAWLQREGAPAQRADRPAHGLPEELERAVLEQASARS
ncbi:MAG: NAD-dependent epimerase/dehydratase family protein [Actinomycetota bacterium]|nr:NAD-dependent epimerase/dehydratase family protein [Actinomycetota bacterium]